MVWIKDWQTCSTKGQIANILCSAGQEAKQIILHRYLYKKKANFHKNLDKI